MEIGKAKSAPIDISFWELGNLRGKKNHCSCQVENGLWLNKICRRTWELFQ